ncbi:unnamed protein product [Trichobilharzia szidati]|nr:unnamed protein product [Trichobilharzia szidati]
MDEYLKNYFNKFIKIIHFLIQNEQNQNEIDVYTKKLCKKVTDSGSIGTYGQSISNEVKYAQQENSNVFPYCFGILTEKIQNNSTSSRPKRDVVRYVLGESQTMNSGITSKLTSKHKLKKTDHQAQSKKNNEGLQTIIQQKNATTPHEEASTGLDGNSNKKNEASGNKAGLFSAIAASTPKSEKKQVKEKDAGKGVDSMKKPAEVEDDRHEEDTSHAGKEKNLLKRLKKQKPKQLKQSPTGSTDTTGEQDDINKKGLGKSRLFKSVEEDKHGKHKGKHTADHDTNADDDGGDDVGDDETPSEHANKRKIRSHLLKSSHDEKDKKGKGSKPAKDADVDDDTRRMDKFKSHKQKKEEEEVKGDVDDQRKHTVKLSKKRQKLQDDEGDEDVEDKEHTKHHDTAYEWRKRRKPKVTSTSSYVDSDEDDIHDEEHSMKRMTKAKTRGKHKVSSRSRYDSADYDDDDEDFDQRDVDDEEDRKHKAHRKPDRKLKDKLKSREKHEFTHRRREDKKRHSKKRHAEKGYRTSSEESSSEDSSSSYAKHEKHCKCGCTESHDTSLRVHCHPEHRDYWPSHYRRRHEYLCHVKESPPSYLHQCKDTEEDDILGTLEQICSDKRRLYKERCCADSSRRKRWSRHNKSVDLKRYLSPQTVKLLKAVEKPSALDGLSMTRLEKKLKQRLPIRSKIDLTLSDKDDCYKCNTSRDLSDNIPQQQQQHPNIFQNPTNMPTWCPPVLPVLSPPRVLVKQIPVPVVLPQCLPTNQPTAYPCPMPPTNPNYFNPSVVGQQMPHYAVPPYCQYP